MNRKKKVIVAVLSLSNLFLFAQENPNKIDTLSLKKSQVFKKPKISSNISRREMEKSTGENLANLLKDISGITILQSGSNISKPVIQGLTNQRIAIINNDIKVEGHHWGNDHAPEIDPFLAQSVEVVKGAEAVKYGANALGGVIVLKSENLPYFGEKIGGRVQLLGESNTRKLAGNIILQGGIFQDNAFAWRVQSSAKKAGNYKTAEYFTNNTGARELNYSANLGYKMSNEKIEAFYSFFSTRLGSYRNAKVGGPYDWELRLLLGRPIGYGKFSYEITPPNQYVRHHLGKISVESDRDFGKLNFTYSFQKNFRQEFDIRRGDFMDRPVFDVELSTHTANLDYQKSHHDNFKNYSGVSVSQQENYNVPGTGVNSILPNSFSRSVGVYLAEEFKLNSWIFNAGVRYDYKSFVAAGYDFFSKLYHFNDAFQNLSYSLGINKTFGRNFSITSNIGMAWRAPDAVELFSNGVFHGNAFYIIGNRNLTSERGLKWSSKAQFNNEKLLVVADFFLQKINGFIYELPTGNFRDTWTGSMPLFVYKQSDAFFKGIDITLKYKPLNWLDYTAKGSVIHATNLTEGFYFPNISPENISHKLNFNLSSLTKLKNSYVEIEHFWANKQWRFSPEADLIPFTPDAYHLFDMALGTDVKVLNNNMNLSLSVHNLFNTLYKDYTDRYRYFVHGMGRNFQLRMNYQF
ncbi:MAG: TonB-dependent receptor [Flavobacteriaceae bacterium]|nr:TonB-dependent receptor [Flavobacteriaceae bacterium]